MAATATLRCNCGRPHEEEYPALQTPGRRAGRGDPGRVSASAAPALLGAQDAESVRGGAAVRSRRGEAGCPTHLSGRQPSCGPASVRAISVSLAGQVFPLVRRLERDLPELLTFFEFPRAPVAEAAHHQCHRAVLCRGAAEDSAHGRVHQCPERGSDHLCDFPVALMRTGKPTPSNYLHRQLDVTPCKNSIDNKSFD